MTKPKEDAVRIGVLRNVPYEPWKVIEHLMALCDQDDKFAIAVLKPLPGSSLGRLLIFDGQKLKEAEGGEAARRAVIGTVRVLLGNKADVIFDVKDAGWGQEITEEGRARFCEFFQRAKDYFRVSESCSASTDGMKKQRGPTIKTQERAKVFRRLKEEHPEWNYDTVALNACEELREIVTGQTVRNAYRAMREAYPDQAEEWTWERADRIR